jgi:hypothetical protein
MIHFRVIALFFARRCASGSYQRHVLERSLHNRLGNHPKPANDNQLKTGQ